MTPPVRSGDSHRIYIVDEKAEPVHEKQAMRKQILGEDGESPGIFDISQRELIFWKINRKIINAKPVQ